MKVAVNEFVRRQVKGSGKTYSKTMSFEAIAEHAQIQMGNGHFSKGYRDGVRIVHCNISIISEFFSRLNLSHISIPIFVKCSRPIFVVDES